MRGEKFIVRRIVFVYALQNMKLNFALLFLFLNLLTISIQAQTSVTIYDPAKGELKADFTDEESEQLKNAIDPLLKKVIAEDTCSGDFQITNATDGAFTRRRAKQRAFLYEYCQYGNGFSYGGIAVTENGKIVANHYFSGGWQMEFWSLPDINNNGLNEMAIHWSGGMHQGKIGTAIIVLEDGSGRLAEIGATQASWSECDGDNSSLKCGYDWKITARKGAKPVFYHQKMTGGDGKKWRVAGKSMAVKFEKSSAKYIALK